MTRIVYVHPNISPDIWTPPPGIVVLSLYEHPAIIEDMEPVAPRPLPPGEHQTPQDNDFIRAVFAYIKEHGQADVVELMELTGADYQRMRNALYQNDTLFRQVGQHVKDGTRRVLWGLVEGAQVRFRAGRPRNPETIQIYDWLKANAPATTATIAVSTGIDQRRVKRAVEDNRRLFCRIARAETDKPGARWVLWGVVEK